MNTIPRLLRGGALLGLPLALLCYAHCNNGDHTGTNGDLGTTNPNADLTGQSGDGGSGGDGGTSGDGGTVDLTPPGGPGIVSISPALGPTTGNIVLTINGSNFPSDGVVYIDGRAATTISSNASQFTVTLPADPGKKGKVAVEIRRPVIGTVTTNPNVFAYYYGTPSFSIAKSFATGATPYAVVLTDLDNNKKLDAVVANYGGKSVSVLLGDGLGGFASQQSYGTDVGPTALTIADFDQNGTPDVASVNAIAETISVLLNPANNGILNTAIKRTLTVGTAPQGIASGLLNGDTLYDVVTANAGSNDGSFLVGMAAGNLAAPVSLGADQGPSAIVTGDLNKDGKLDLIVANSNSSTVSALLGDGAGNFGAKTIIATGNGQPKSLAVADFDGDGKLDVAVALNGGLGKQIAVMLGKGDGSFNAANLYTAGTQNLDAPFAIAAKDLNGDGLPDLVVTLNGNTKVAVLLNQSGTFPTQLFYAAGLTTTCNPRGLALDDLDGDGNPDIVVTNQTDSTISVLLNKFQ